tara:strand:+ start:117 stop:473 length:357 start_codon:yes stop_codon:yes gene_type:complete
MATKVKEHPIWDRKLTEADKQQINNLMKMNPAIDYLLAETIVLMPPERFKEICDNRKNNPTEPEPAKVLTEEEMHTGTVFTDEEQKEIEEQREKKEKEQHELYDKIQKEKEQLKEIEE